MSGEADRPIGERRRRREAERAAAQEAEAAGVVRPLTRRELRRLQAEEEARLEAIATGELPLGDFQERDLPSVPAATEPPTTTTGPSAASPATAGSAPSSASGASGTSPVTAGSAPSAETGATRLPSRRALRERAREVPTGPEERPQERTATGRRPVIRTPSTAQGVRSLDSTGQLTGIQPVVRPDSPAQPAPAPDAERSWTESATFSVDLPADIARQALPPAERAPHEPPPHEPTPEPRSADDADHDDEGEDMFPLRPQWVAISRISGASPDEAKSPLPTRRSLRAAVPEPEREPEPEPRRGNPAVTLIKIAILVIVAAVIGALIWLLATEAFTDDTTGAAATAAVTITHHEESSAR